MVGRPNFQIEISLNGREIHANESSRKGPVLHGNVDFGTSHFDAYFIGK